MHSPTPEQKSILEFVHAKPNNLMIRALAGTGKSETLKMIDQQLSGTALYIVFNRENADKARKEFRSLTLVKTANGLGDKVWRDTCAHKVTLSKTKVLDIFRQKTEDMSRLEAKEMWQVYDSVRSGVDMARNLGYVPPHMSYGQRTLCLADDVYDMLDEPPSPLAKELIDICLAECIRQALKGCIDYNDQCYMAALFGSTFPKFPIVMVDEYQDLNPVQHHLLQKVCKHSRQIGVGDDAQSIYAFRGAVVGGMSKAISLFDMAEMSLTVSFRCPSAIVENAKWRVPDFKAFRDGGSVKNGKGLGIDDNSTVICRNNAPLLELAMAMLWQGRSVSVAGVDIAHRLLTLLTKLGPEDMPTTAAIDATIQWEANKPDSKSAKDMAGCMRAFLHRAKTLGGAIATARHAFEQHGTVQFMTGHKSKGLEFDTVYHLTPDLCRDDDQDRNLRYVIDTRSKDRLIYV